MFKISELNKLSGNILLFYFMIIIATLCGGLLFIFAFNRSLFMELDFPRLFLLSIVVTLPIFVFNCLLIGRYKITLRKLSEKEQPYYIMFNAAVLTMIFYPLIAVRLFYVFDVRIAIMVVIMFEIAFFLAYLLEFKEARREKIKGNKGDGSI